MAKVLGLYKQNDLLELRIRDDARDGYFRPNCFEIYFKNKEAIKDFIVQLREELTKD